MSKEIFIPIMGRASDVLGVQAAQNDTETQQQTQQQQNQVPQYAGQQPQQPNVTQPVLDQQTQVVTAPLPGQQPQQTTQQQQPLVDQTQLQQASEAANAVDLNALEQQLSQITDPNATQQQPTQQTQQQQQTTNVEDAPGFAQFNEQAKQYLGVDIKTAINNYQEIVTVAQNVLRQAKQSQQETYLREQNLQLQSQWMSDPEVQQLMQQGQSLQQITNDRLAHLGRVYRALPASSRQKVDAAGVQGVMALWNSTRQQTVVQQMPTSIPQASNVNPGQKRYRWSEIAAMNDRDFQSIGMQLLDSGNYIDDRQQGAGNNAILQRTFS